MNRELTQLVEKMGQEKYVRFLERFISLSQTQNCSGIYFEKRDTWEDIKLGRIRRGLPPHHTFIVPNVSVRVGFHHSLAITAVNLVGHNT